MAIDQSLDAKEMDVVDVSGSKGEGGGGGKQVRFGQLAKHATRKIRLENRLKSAVGAGMELLRILDCLSPECWTKAVVVHRERLEYVAECLMLAAAACTAAGGD